jgi:DNA polymerase III alpha subunit
LLDGVPSPEALIARAADYDMLAIALTDHDALYGAVRFAEAARQAGIKPIFGAEITLVNGGGHITLLAENDEGYANLCRIITRARRDQAKGFAALHWRLLAEYRTGLIALSGCARSEISRAVLERKSDKAKQAAQRFAAIFGKGNFYVELQRHYERDDRRLNAGLVEVARRSNCPSSPRATPTICQQQRLRCTTSSRVFASASHSPGRGLLRGNAEYLLRSPQDTAALFSEWPDALPSTLEIAARCTARLPLARRPCRMCLPLMVALQSIICAGCVRPV